MAYGVTKDGFVRPRLPEIRQMIIDNLKELLRAKNLSDDIETRPDSVTGLMIDTFAEREAAIWEMGEGVYFAMYPGSAYGVSLDRAASFTGVKRLQAERSRAYVVAYGAIGTTIPAGSRIAHASTQTLWQTKFSAIINLLNASDLTVVPVVQNSALYSVTIDNISYEYTSGAAATLTDILAGLTTAMGTNAIVTNNGASLRIRPVNAQIFSVILTDNLAVNRIGSAIQAESVDVSTEGAAVGTLNSIVTLIDGWESVTNMEEASPGRLAETDDELRARYDQGVFRLGAGTLPSIAPNIRENVPNVTAVKVFENNTDAVDASGRPPHSLHVVVDGGIDLDIAKEIYRIKAAGIDTHGAIEKSFISVEGEQTIRFDRPYKVYVWIKAVVTIQTGEGNIFPFDGFQRITQSLLITGINHDIGQDVILQKFYSGVYQTNGIASIDLTMAHSSDPDFIPAPEDYTANNIVIEEYEVAVFSMSRIEVN